MTTEPEVVDTPKKDNKVLDSTAIAAKIEFALGKDDFTDMILEEHHEALETQLRTTEEELKALDKKMYELDQKHSAYLIGEFKKEFAKEIKSAKKYVGDVKIEVDSTCHKVRLNDPKQFKLSSYTARDEYSHKPRRTVEHFKTVDGWCAYRGVYATVTTVKNPDNVTYGTQSNVKFTHEKSEWTLRRNYSDAEVLSMPLVKELAELDKTRQDIRIKAYQLENDMANLEVSGKRAKSKLVRSLLSASEQGRQLLEKMPKMGSRLLLVDGNG